MEYHNWVPIYCHTGQDLFRWILLDTYFLDDRYSLWVGRGVPWYFLVRDRDFLIPMCMCSYRLYSVVRACSHWEYVLFLLFCRAQLRIFVQSHWVFRIVWVIRVSVLLFGGYVLASVNHAFVRGWDLFCLWWEEMVRDNYLHNSILLWGSLCDKRDARDSSPSLGVVGWQLIYFCMSQEPLLYGWDFLLVALA